MAWLKDTNDDIYDPSYTDMLRVAFTSEFRRGKLQDLVALLSGRNFETKEYQEAIAEQSFARLKQGVLSFINQTHFERLVMILRSAGFVSSNLISGQNAVNFAYILYLRGRAEKMGADDIERVVRRWFVMSLLTGDRIVADVIAGTRCFVLMIPQAVFSTDILSNPKALGYLSRLLADRTRAMSIDMVTAQARAVAKSSDPYALTLNSSMPGKVVVLNVGLSQIHFGIYDTHDLGADIHGIIDSADQTTCRVSVTVGPQTKTMACPHFPIADLFKVMKEASQLLGDAFIFHPEDVTAIGHRVVHGGSRFSSSVVITPAVIADIHDRVRVLPDEYNYPLPKRRLLPPGVRELELDDLVHVHYHRWGHLPGFLRV